MYSYIAVGIDVIQQSGLSITIRHQTPFRAGWVDENTGTVP